MLLPQPNQQEINFSPLQNMHHHVLLIEQHIQNLSFNMFGLQVLKYEVYLEIIKIFICPLYV